MNFRYNKYRFLCIKLLVVMTTTAQEYLKPLGGNINVNHVSTQPILSISKVSSNMLYDTLPFFDDFSYAYKTPYPTAKHWLDSNVYVNTGFAIAPLSLGVATFDGLNKKGYPYNLLAPASSSAPADYLTSRPVNLYKKGSYLYSPADSMYLSFYYQAGGYGEAPQTNDSLCVDFYKPKQQKWQKVWGRKGYNPNATDTNFYRVMLPIKDTAYFDSLFQFRFRNNAALSGSVDHWHIDYVYLNKDRFIKDTIIEDLTYAYQPTSFLKNYSVIPYRQYMASEMGTSFRNYFRSNFTVDKFMSYKYTVYDKTGALVYTENLGAVGSPGIQPFMNNGYYSGMPHANPTLTTSPFSTSLTDSTYYQIEHVLTTTGDLIPANDTVIHTQRFSDYYAYDDGSAERAYYLHNAYGAKIAVRYTLNVDDTIRAVNVFFDPVVDGQLIQSSSFRVVVWADGNNGPGNVLYRDSLRYPIYLQGSYNLIPTYTLTSCLPLKAGTYHVGIQQTANLGLNIGFDRNTNHMNALYYDVGNGWTPSAIKGSLMINPIMGCTVPQPVGVDEYFTGQTFGIFPNPARNTITVRAFIPEPEDVRIAIVSAIGQAVLQVPFHNNNPIDVSELPSGIYLVYLHGRNVNETPKKLIISN